MPSNNIWAPIDFKKELYYPIDDDARIAAIRAGIERELQYRPELPPSYVGEVTAGRTVAEVACENYRVLLRRIDLLEHDLTEARTGEDDEPEAV